MNVVCAMSHFQLSMLPHSSFSLNRINIPIEALFDYSLYYIIGLYGYHFFRSKLYFLGYSFSKFIPYLLFSCWY